VTCRDELSSRTGFACSLACPADGRWGIWQWQFCQHPGRPVDLLFVANDRHRVFVLCVCGSEGFVFRRGVDTVNAALESLLGIKDDEVVPGNIEPHRV
jgi:hypothetical protein